MNDERTRTDTRADDRSGDRAGENGSMADVSHTNPATNETFGAVFRRGPAVADGGAAPKRPEERQPTADVDHTPRNGTGSNGVWKRGADGDESENVAVSGVEVDGDE